MRCRPALLALTLGIAACGGGTSSLPLTTAPPPEPESSAVFVGRSTAFRHVRGAWERLPSYDYEFTVVANRFAGRWDVVKELHRRHPDYDGLAGPRDQTLHFEIRATPARDGGTDLAVHSTLGSGTGREAPDGHLSLDLTSASRGWFVPFDSVRIRQDPPDASGRIRETVELFSRKGGAEIPFMRMEESGRLFVPVRNPRKD